VWEVASDVADDGAGGDSVVTRNELLDIHEAWARGRSVSQIARETGKDRKTIRRMLKEGGPSVY
jgi:DNA-binding phage protein